MTNYFGNQATKLVQTCFHDSLDIANDQGDDLSAIKASLALGLCVLYTDPQNALEWFTRALERSLAKKDLEHEALCYVHLGAASNVLSDLNNALSYHEKALQLGE